MDAREQRGLVLAATKNIRQVDDKWRVPSSDGEWHYFVSLEGRTCTCPDHEIRGVKCKHQWAVEYALKREEHADGSVTETETVRVTKKRTTYPQHWSAYNTAQQVEKERFATLLRDLCADVPQPAQAKGRPRLPLSDMAFAATLKVYSGFSSRRFTRDVREAQRDGLITTAPHFNSVSNYLGKADLTLVLKALIEASSLPLRAVETDFAVDSTGFSTSRFVTWYSKKYGRSLDNREWVKAHAMIGVRTNVVTAVEVSDWTAPDSPYFTGLLESTARRFALGDVTADKAYLSHKNTAAVVAMGGTPFIPFKTNTVPVTGDSPWARMYHYFAFNREAFLAHYHQRSNVETTFSMVKGKFGDSVRSKSDRGQVNEVLCKMLAHNICVVIKAMETFGLQANFCAEAPVAQKVAS